MTSVYDGCFPNTPERRILRDLVIVKKISDPLHSPLELGQLPDFVAQTMREILVT